MSDDDNVVPIKPKTGRDGSRRTPGPGAGNKRKVGNGGTGLPAMGAGWGGPAKGAQDHGPGRMPNGPERDAKLRTNEEIRVRALAKIDALIDSDQQGIALQASQAALDRVEGKAIQRVAATPNGETVEELRTIDASQLTIEQRDALRAAILAEKERRG